MIKSKIHHHTGSNNVTFVLKLPKLIDMFRPRFLKYILWFKNVDNYVMLPPEGPNQISNCGEKRPLDDSQRQSVLVQQKNGKNW